MRKKIKKIVGIRFMAWVFFLFSLVIFGFAIGTRFNLPYTVNKFKSNFNRFESSEISAAELKINLGKKDFLLVNVHTPYEGEIGLTDTFIEYDSMLASQNILPKDKNAKIVLYCKSGRMSEEALKTLSDMGYTNIAHLEGGMDSWEDGGFEVLNLSSLPSQVLPDDGFELPISWGDLGPKLSSLGVIDKDKFVATVKPTDEQRKILEEGSSENITIDSQNAYFVVDMLWALGLAQKSIVYDEGPMGKDYKDTVGNFASTGGWSLAKGEAVSYLNKYSLIDLSVEEHARVAEISKHVFRPCCGNATWFPDCNHGMAALAAIELMVDKGISDEEIYKNILKLNSFWFPQHYLMAATYFARQGTPWEKVDAKLVLDQGYSSGQAAAQLSSKVGPLPYEQKKNVGGSCGA